jgi:hypothetical protein
VSEFIGGWAGGRAGSKHVPVQLKASPSATSWKPSLHVPHRHASLRVARVVKSSQLRMFAHAVQLQEVSS